MKTEQYIHPFSRAVNVLLAGGNFRGYNNISLVRKYLDPMVGKSFRDDVFSEVRGRVQSGRLAYGDVVVALGKVGGANSPKAVESFADAAHYIQLLELFPSEKRDLNLIAERRPHLFGRLLASYDESSIKASIFASYDLSSIVSVNFDNMRGITSEDLDRVMSLFPNLRAIHLSGAVFSTFSRRPSELMFAGERTIFISYSTTGIDALKSYASDRPTLQVKNWMENGDPRIG